MYFVAGVLMALSLTHGGAAPQFFSKRMYQWISQGYTDVWSTVELHDVLPGTEFYNQLHRVNELDDILSGTEFYNQLHRVNESRKMADFQLALGNSTGKLG